MKQYLVTITALLILSLASMGQIPRSAYVVNALSENLSVINLENQTVTIDAEPLGLFTNQVMLRNQRAYVVNSGANDIQVIDLATVNTVHHIDVGSGTNPFAMDFINDTLAAVSLLLTNQVAFVNLNSGQIETTVTVGTGPEGLRYHDGRVFVANSGFNGAGYDPGIVSIIDLNPPGVTPVPVALNPQSVDIAPDGRVVVACTGDYGNVTGRVNVIDPATASVVDSALANTFITAVAVNSQGKAYLATFGFGVLVYDLNTGIFERDVADPLPGGPGIAFDAVDNAYLTDFGNDSVYVYSPTHQRLHAYAVGDGPLSIAIYEPGGNSIAPEDRTVAQQFLLYPNFPNPFNPETTIRFDLRRSLPVRLEVYNLAGQRIRTLVNGRLSAGLHAVQWDGHNDAGIPAPSGIYFYRLQAGSEWRARPMHLIR